ncbi:MAG: hypothetical protein ACI4J7_03610 [Ruminiclostridium sp.]
MKIFDIDIEFLLLVLVVAGSFITIIGGIILRIKERYSYGTCTKKYLSGIYKDRLSREYPGWKISVNEKNISKKELGKKCASCVQDLSQCPLYYAGTLTKAFGQNFASVRIFVTVRPSYTEEKNRGPDVHYDTEYHTWLIFDVKPLNGEKFNMSGSFYAGNYHPLPGAQIALNNLGQYMSDKGDRKYDMKATISGGKELDNNVTLSYSGVRRDKWQEAVNSGLTDIINRIYSDWGRGMRLDYSREKLTLAVWIKMPDNEMYEGHNDFAAANPELISSTAERLSEIAVIIDRVG